MIETAASAARRHAPPLRLLATLSLALLVFSVLYRFNTLGGALGGFDDDHFVPFAYAKQVQAGEQPLRDFTGLGLQGAWPSLTFELSAAAQSWLGNSLRSEAILSVTGIAAAAVFTLWAAAGVAPAWLAAGATLLSVLVAPKLYNYPKVLVLSAAALAIVWYARRPAMRAVAALSLVTAVAFLFRHDYAVYVGVGVLVLFAVSGNWIRAVLHGTAYAGLVLALLAPSLVFVQRHAGLATYLRDSLAASEQEASRTDMPWPVFTMAAEEPAAVTSFFGIEQNAVSWLYYLHLIFPALVLVGLWRTRLVPWPDARPALAAIAVAGLFVAPFFLRGNTGARLGDMAPLFAVVLAGGSALSLRKREGESGLAWAARNSVLMVVVAITVQAIWVVGGVARELDTSGWSASAGKVIGQARRRWSELERLPAAYWIGPPESPSVAAVQYLHRCSGPADRILMVSYQPEILPLADRRFAAGRASVIPGLLTGTEHERRMVERWSREQVPLALVEEDESHRSEIPLLHAYLTANYERGGDVVINGDVRLGVFAHRTSAHQPDRATGLPCFR